MRPVIASTRGTALSLLFAAGCFAAAQSADKTIQPATLLLQFEQSHSERTLQAVRTELDSIMRSAGFTFDLRLFSELSPDAEFGDLMIVRLKGRCRMDAAPMGRPDQGPLAFTHVSNGRVIPFVEVACDRVRSSIRPVMLGEQLKRGDEMMGRALARVIAHEIYHIRTGSAHGTAGIARHALSGHQLTAEYLQFDAADIERMISAAGASGAGL